VEAHFRCDEEGIVWKEQFRGSGEAIARYLVRVSPAIVSGGVAEGPAMEIEHEPLLEKTARIERPPGQKEDK